MSYFVAACFRVLALCMACSVLIFSLVADPGHYSNLAGWCQMLFGGFGVAEVFLGHHNMRAIQSDVESRASAAKVALSRRAFQIEHTNRESVRRSGRPHMP